MAFSIAATPRKYDPDASVILVGCHGAGKFTLAFIGSIHLGRPVIGENYLFQTITGLSKSQYLKAYGKDDFNAKCTEVFKNMLKKYAQGYVLACGQTSITAEGHSTLRALCQTHPVIYVHRGRQYVERHFDPAHSENILQTDQLHRFCTNLEYFNLYDPSIKRSKGRLVAVRADFNRFLDAVTAGRAKRALIESPLSIEAIPPECRAFSYAMRLRLSYLMKQEFSWKDLEARADCVEFVVDVWPDNVAVVVACMVAWIRRHTDVPVIYHVEENPPNVPPRKPDEKERFHSSLYEVGLRLGVEYVSVDLHRSQSLVAGVMYNKGRAKVIGNFWHLPGPCGSQAVPWTDDVHAANYKWARDLGCDVVRMMRFCSAATPPELAGQMCDRVMKMVPDPKPALVAYDYSVLGVRMPLQCRVLNPVKHECVPDSADFLTGACTYPESFKQLFRSMQLQPLQFFVLGADVGYSLSPAMHAAAYEFSGMPHTFRAVPCSDIDDLLTICVSDTFGGASLTAPFKVQVLQHLSRWSYHADAIGAVNVVLPLRGGDEHDDGKATMLDHANARNRSGRARHYFGDNTDWSSILVCLRLSLSPANHVQPSKTTALVVGAGGMARAAIYALDRLGCRQIFIYNRTVANAEAVAAHFNTWAAKRDRDARDLEAQQALQSPTPPPPPVDICHVLSSIDQPWPEGYLPPTIVISCVPASGPDPSRFTMPLAWLQSPTGGVVMELAYDNVYTPLVAQMLAFDTMPPWIVVDGLTIVSEMAIEAFELQTGRLAPRMLMRNVCRETWEKQQQARYAAAAAAAAAAASTAASSLSRSSGMR